MNNRELAAEATYRACKAIHSVLRAEGLSITEVGVLNVLADNLGADTAQLVDTLRPSFWEWVHQEVNDGDHDQAVAAS